MAGRATYTDEDKARVYVVLTANDGNVKRTARETGVPENTVRRWKKEFEKEAPQADIVDEAVGDFLEKTDRVRWKIIEQIEKKIPDAKFGELTTGYGILTDKADRVRGIGDRKVVEHKLPSVDEIREALGAFAEEARALAHQREAEIVDAEIVEQPALPSGS